ncbi:YHS domain-containing (seleno)protein [Daejeonella sp.]|uniref:YHS domain-containing (seleno)protein n=1 Tax=Daejeonella sp. TaxID=2805397 RepID=UPI0027312ED0|nr:YHS domain-containing (seleno)protein [Daejeonella sp.]MDP2415645.1 YHS domain-containing (seleno)protein [Daejeonella sp.]
MKTLVSIFLIFLFINTSSAQNAQRVKNFNIDKTTLAIEGYDPVAYFTLKKGVEGKKEISLVREGIIYQFSSIQNRELFKINPSKYEPQFGGWCAYAMGENGEKVSVDPQTFKVLDGKLYLFYNKFFNNTLKEWNKNENALRQKAEINWTKFK